MKKEANKVRGVSPAGARRPGRQSRGSPREARAFAPVRSVSTQLRLGGHGKMGKGACLARLCPFLLVRGLGRTPVVCTKEKETAVHLPMPRKKELRKDREREKAIRLGFHETESNWSLSWMWHQAMRSMRNIIMRAVQHILWSTCLGFLNWRINIGSSMFLTAVASVDIYPHTLAKM